MPYRLLLSGQRSCFTSVAFDEKTKKLDILADYQAPYNASWVEPWASNDSLTQLIGLSEGDDSGLLYTFEIDHSRASCRITSQQPTRGAPAHCKQWETSLPGVFADLETEVITLQDKSALALATVSISADGNSKSLLMHCAVLGGLDRSLSPSDRL